ncbi:hypothetical protein Pcac1_g5584 [Phytophthora cactorum]|nr:hypothetical protein Pcac1_g5584 [Phytophthora cactorum]
MGRGRRPRVNQNGGRRPNQFKNSTPTYEHHLQIVRFYANNSMKETLARYFPDAQGTTKETKRKSIHLWAKNKAKTERLGSTNATRAMRKLRERATAPTREEVVRWVVEAWDDLSTTTISNGFSGILRESPNDEDTEATFNVITDKLAQLHLLDEDVGEVESEDDIVDRVLREASV